MIIKESGAIYDGLETMYPTFAVMVEGEFSIEADQQYLKYSTVYGYCFENVGVKVVDTYLELDAKDFFSFPLKDNNFSIISEKAFLVFRLGFQGQTVSGTIEKKGRLSYIDNCSDSMLVYPPRKGDPSLNALFFPPKIEQSFHTHPSIRIGCVIEGRGEAWRQAIVNQGTYSTRQPAFVDLKRGDMFYLEENEIHRFSTLDGGMQIVAFHPDGDWGPTDQDHAMLNRTYLK